MQREGLPHLQESVIKQVEEVLLTKSYVDVADVLPEQSYSFECKQLQLELLISDHLADPSINRNVVWVARDAVLIK